MMPRDDHTRTIPSTARTAAELQRRFADGDDLVEAGPPDVADLLARVAEYDGHRHQWRRRAAGLHEALEAVLRAADAVLVRPVADAGCVVPLGTRHELQEACRRAAEVIAEGVEGEE